MKTIRNRNSARGHHSYSRRDDERDEFSQRGMEDPWRNEDYFFDRYHGRRGFSNRDYSESNYWPVNDRIRDEHYGNDNNYVPSINYGRERYREGYFRPSGYGNEGSGLMREYERWTSAPRNDEDGYRDRDSREYRQEDYGDRHYYDPSDYYPRGERTDRQANNYDDYAREGRYSDERNGLQTYSYGDYESYPSYRSPEATRDDNWPQESNRHRRRGDYGQREYVRAHRPNIREKKY